jgi:hypothetical protein
MGKTVLTCPISFIILLYAQIAVRFVDLASSIKANFDYFKAFKFH